MLHTILQGLPELLLILITAVATHFFMSLAQTLMHYALGDHPIGGKFFRNHIAFHHTYYCGDHLVSQTSAPLMQPLASAVTVCAVSRSAVVTAANTNFIRIVRAPWPTNLRCTDEIERAGFDRRGVTRR
jgi:hypothetical protein